MYLHKNSAFKPQKPKLNNAPKVKKIPNQKRDLDRLKQGTTSVVSKINKSNTNTDSFNPKSFINYSTADLSVKYINE